MISIDYFRTIQNQKGLASLKDAEIEDGKARLREDLRNSVHFLVGKRNGVAQEFVVTPSEAYHKYEIEAMPDEDLFVGDEIECLGEHWIVVKTRVGSPFQTIGLMWLCNYKFRWQSFTPTVIERWGVLDSGVYSTTRDGDGDLVTPDKQFKLYFPKDAETQKLFIDKRLAVEVLFDSHGKQVLNVYRITGYDSISSSYGKNGHLLVLNARSDDYVPNRDSITELICDYIAPSPAPPVQTGTINGPTTIRAGRSRTYTADFTVSTWVCSQAMSGITLTADDDSAVLSVDLDDDLVGEIITLVAEGTTLLPLEEEGGEPTEQVVRATLDVEVIS